MANTSVYLNQRSNGGRKGFLRVHAEGADSDGNRLRSNKHGLAYELCDARPV
jgi:hypothetical protein